MTKHAYRQPTLFERAYLALDEPDRIAIDEMVSRIEKTLGLNADEALELLAAIGVWMVANDVCPHKNF